MPHITEGLLHAHLDGALGPDEQLQWAEAEAHLEVCDDCRRRLDEAAELRAAARDLLAGATPSRSVARPAFDEIAARARARRADPAAGRRPFARAGRAWWRTPATLGWAASLVIAASAGWMGRQLAIEQGLDVPPVAAEQDAPAGGAGMEVGAAQDDIRGEATPDEAQARRDAAATPAAPETAARFRTETEAEPSPGGRPEAEELQEKAEPRRTAEPGDDADAGAEVDAGGEADGNQMQDIAPLTAGAGATSGARCYAASPAADDGREATAGRVQSLRLAPDGTATLQFDGRPMVGFWQRAEAGSLHLRVTDGEQWRELVLIEAESGVRGDAELETVDCP